MEVDIFKPLCLMKGCTQTLEPWDHKASVLPLYWSYDFITFWNKKKYLSLSDMWCSNFRIVFKCSSFYQDYTKLDIFVNSSFSHFIA